MNDLNEKLAELCGLTLGYNPMCGNVYRNAEGLTMYEEADWNPTADLNQLKMCYEALSEDEKLEYFGISSAECGDIFIDQVGHAQAILKAKGVS